MHANYKLEKRLLSNVMRGDVPYVVNESWRGDLGQLRDACASEHGAAARMD
jgi:hypothetical protein